MTTRHIAQGPLGRALAFLGNRRSAAAAIALLVAAGIGSAMIAAQQLRYAEAQRDLARILLGLERALGYDGFIHNFKNYVLRPEETVYRDAAAEDHATAMDLLAEMNALNSRFELETSLENLTTTIGEYRTALDEVERLRADGLDSNEIDTLVRISDQLASADLARAEESLRERLEADADAIRTAQYAVFLGVTALLILSIAVVAGYMLQRRRQAELLAERRKLIVDEVNHRMRNLLAVTQAISKMTRAGVDTLDAFSEAFNARISALAQTQAIGLADGHDAASLARLIETQAGPYRAQFVLELGAREHWIDGETTLMFGLVLHELRVNATKYGALSVPEGRVTVTAMRDAAGALEIRWVESGGPEVRPPGRTGFGSEMIERALKHQFRAETEVDYAPAGLEVRLVLPAEMLADEHEVSGVALV